MRMTGTREDEFHQAVAFVKEGRTDEARNRLLQLLKRDPHHVRAWILLARIAKRPERRRRILQRCVELNPESALAQRAWAALDAGDDDPENSPQPVRDDESHDSPTPQRVADASPWLWLGIAGGGVVLVVAVLAVIFALAPRMAATPPTATPTPTSMPTSTPSPTVTPQPSPTLTPTPSQLETLETWLPPLTASSLLSSTCESLLSMSQAITAEVGTLEYEFEVSLGVSMISAMESELSDLGLDAWEPPASLAPYKERLEVYNTELRQIADRWVAQDLTPQQIPDALSETCPAVREATTQLVAAAEQEGFTREQLMGALLETRRRGEDTPAPAAPAALGASRANPYPADAVVPSDRWLIQVRETVRGEEAWDLIRGLPFAEPAPEGMTYLLVHLHVKNDTTDSAKRSLNRHDFGVTGDRLRRYEADPFVAPSPEFDVNMPGGWETTGWLTFLVGEDEDSLILIFDPLFGEEASYIALEENAAIAMPTRRTLPIPNELGVEPDAPVPFGEAAVTEDWSVALLDTVRGREAWDLLEGASIFNQPAPEGEEYLLVKARVRYVSRHEEVGEISGYSFSTTKNPDASPPAVTGLRPSLAARLFPGGEVTGWFELLIPEGQNVRVVFEPPMALTGEQRRYFALP
jgi:hypothetical protein